MTCGTPAGLPGQIFCRQKKPLVGLTEAEKLQDFQAGYLHLIQPKQARIFFNRCSGLLNQPGFERLPDPKSSENRQSPQDKYDQPTPNGTHVTGN